MSEQPDNRADAREYIGHLISMVAHDLCARAAPKNGIAKYHARHLDVFPSGRQIADQVDGAVQGFALVKALRTDAARTILAAMLENAVRRRADWRDQDLPEKIWVRLRPRSKILRLDTAKIEAASGKIIARTLTQFAARNPEDLKAYQAIIAPQP